MSGVGRVNFLLLLRNEGFMRQVSGWTEPLQWFLATTGSKLCPVFTGASERKEELIFGSSH